MKKIVLFTVLLLLVLIWKACKKPYDLPPIRQPNDGARITIAQIKNKYSPYSIYKFKGDTNLYCVVIADEVSGNLYKDIYARDATGGIHIKLTASGGLFIGDSIRINLNDIVLNSYSDLIQLDSVDVTKSVVKLASGLKPIPEEVSIPQLIANPTGTNKTQSLLVKLNAVEFIAACRNQPYANAVTKAASQYTLQDCEGKQILLRTSGFCYFANQNTPEGNGSIIAIASQFNNAIQLILRNPDEVNMTGPHCIITTPTVATTFTYLSKNFEDGSATSGGWLNVNALGTVNWGIKTLTTTVGNNMVAECNNYISSGNQPICETWLISPPLNLSAATAPGFSFTSAGIFSGPQLQTLVSTNYNSGAPASATWTFVYPTYGLSATHAPSGEISLLPYKKENVRIAFKYSGNNGSGQRWQVDNIWVGE